MTEAALTTDLGRSETDLGETTSASVRVIDAVAAATDADPLAMDPLHDAVDPDALDQLVAGAADVQVAFEYANCDVVVHGDGAVVVDGSEMEVR